MDENKQMLELLQQMEKNSRKQVRLGRMQCLFSLAAAVFCGAAFLTLLQALPQLGAVLKQMQTVLTNLEITTEQLAGIDLTGMVSGVDKLVTTAQQGLTETMGKLGTIDFETLNKAIDDLAAVVEPLAKVSSVFR